MLSENLKRIREQKGFSKMQLEEASGISRRTIMLIETGRTKNPGIKTLNNLAKALKVSVEKLIK